MKAVFEYIKGDKVIWIIVLLLSIISVLVVYSSVETLAYRSHSGNASYFLIKHLIIILFGFLLIYITHNVKYTIYSRISQIALYVSVPLLLFTLLKGVNEGNATRWLQIPGTGLTFQTSDFAKLALLIYVARMMAIKQNELHDFRNGFLPIIVPVIGICGLIFPSNFSTAFLLFLNCLFLMFIGQAKMRHLLLTIGVAIAGAGLFILIVFAFPHINNRVSTWKSRIESFTKGDKADNYQADQAMIAISTGGIMGKGPGNSTQKNFLPQASSDFIYSILVEEYGTIMGIGIIFLYLTLLYRGVRIATRNPKTFGSLMAIGLTLNLVMQALVNMCVAVHLMPVTGQPLPLVSMGGTSIWFTSIAVGIILSVSRETEKQTEDIVATT
ncbi:MAG TPA: FtsW/RodA/SpoVE family cell cycle protein [Bacteroidia bacterium]|nr:FtsW/RodA/SpoVE family cell cycle protein [Bacteroidia bacterium]